MPMDWEPCPGNINTVAMKYLHMQLKVSRFPKQEAAYWPLEILQQDGKAIFILFSVISAQAGIQAFQAVSGSPFSRG
jgi:hypothetical protein